NRATSWSMDTASTPGASAVQATGSRAGGWTIRLCTLPGRRLFRRPRVAELEQRLGHRGLHDFRRLGLDGVWTTLGARNEHEAGGPSGHQIPRASGPRQRAAAASAASRCTARALLRTGFVLQDVFAARDE